MDCSAPMPGDAASVWIASWRESKLAEMNSSKSLMVIVVSDFWGVPLCGPTPCPLAASAGCEHSPATARAVGPGRSETYRLGHSERPRQLWELGCLRSHGKHAPIELIELRLGEAVFP